MVGAGAETEIFDKLEPEPKPKFLTSWSRSRTKMDRLRNTAFVVFHQCSLLSPTRLMNPVSLCPVEILIKWP
jgi:hypothetical protein